MQLKNIFRLREAIWSLLYLIEVLLLFRFILVFMRASLNSGLVQFIFIISQQFVQPFQYIISFFNLEVFPFSLPIILAMLVYFVITKSILLFLSIIHPIEKI